MRGVPLIHTILFIGFGLVSLWCANFFSVHQMHSRCHQCEMCRSEGKGGGGGAHWCVTQLPLELTVAEGPLGGGGGKLGGGGG